MAGEVPNLRGGHFETVKWVIGILCAGAAFFGGIVWQAARYPDRAEFNELRNTMIRMQLDMAVSTERQKSDSEAINEIKATVKALQVQQAEKGRRER